MVTFIRFPHWARCYGQGKIFEYILDHVKEQQKKLDLIFVTGDIAYSGQEDQYKTFSDKFIKPMRRLVGASVVWLMVPGNHDVDRRQVKYVGRDDILQNRLRVFEPTDKGRTERQCLLPGVKNYDQFIAHPGNWLTSNKGYFIWRNHFHGQAWRAWAQYRLVVKG